VVELQAMVVFLTYLLQQVGGGSFVYVAGFAYYVKDSSVFCLQKEKFNKLQDNTATLPQTYSAK